MTIAQSSRLLSDDLSDDLSDGLSSDAAEGVARCAAAHTAQAERDRRLAPEVVDALVGAGFARHFVPTRFSGDAGGFSDLAAAVATVGERCLSAAWCALIFATSSRMAALLPLPGQQEIWSDRPDVLIAAGLVPGGVAVEVPGGYRLTGTWRPLSGVDFADWALLCAPIADRRGDSKSEPQTGPQSPPQLHFFAVQRRDFTVLDSWDTVGMRGTGSNSVVVDGAVVPPGRVFAHASLLRGGASSAEATCHRAPLLAVASPLFVSPALGAARGALAAWSDGIRDQSGPDGPASTIAFNQLTLAEVSADIDVAALLVQRALQVADSGQFAPALAARNARDASRSAVVLTGAIDRLFRAAGAPAQQSGAAVQRAWRDIHCATSHAALRPDRAALHHAKAVWG